MIIVYQESRACYKTAIVWRRIIIIIIIFISGYHAERPQKPIELATIKQHKENCKNEKNTKK